MGNTHSKELWSLFAYEIGAACIFYTTLYAFMVHWLRTRILDMSPKDCLSITTNIGSTLHSLLMVAFSLSFFTEQRWANPVVDEPRAAGHGICIGTAYYLIDALLHVAFFANYDAKTIPRRLDIIFHHLISFLFPLFLVNCPDPYYGWAPLCMFMATEFSTIFLNAQWFAKYFKMPKLHKWCKLAFVSGWFLVRLPAVVYCSWWLIAYWNEIIERMPRRVFISIIAFVASGSLLQLTWTALIVLKLIKALTASANTNTLSAISKTHAHGVSMEYTSEKPACADAK
eukprot:CAMPEP_0197028696 /NCGR_PEP_ID=MMETSP1384-20130603/8321_1 /TAXON_ID=29189 /ORGANISM="Ammonia sp." /LENGTH=284 /DNA_ID=CAMNT_0042457737 /DNA_START=37 /DNA_END=891 /DNA_ORIENTATION=-